MVMPRIKKDKKLVDATGGETSVTVHRGSDLARDIRRAAAGCTCDSNKIRRASCTATKHKF